VTPVLRIRIGELEKAVLEHLWSVDAADAKAVHSAVGTQRGITLSTIQSTLERLHNKGLLCRGKVSHAYVYVPKVQREELMGRIIEDVMTAFADGKSQPMLSAFVDFAARVDEKNLDRLERLIAARRREAQEPKP
jgi:predicted transcriptional regulator